jgi:hypothetical protein
MGGSKRDHNVAGDFVDRHSAARVSNSTQITLQKYSLANNSTSDVVVVCGSLGAAAKGPDGRSQFGHAQITCATLTHWLLVGTKSIACDLQMIDGSMDDADGVAESFSDIREQACISVKEFLAEVAQDADRATLNERYEVQGSLDALKCVRSIVASFRKVELYFHKSTKAKDRLNAIQKPPRATGPPATQLLLDCPTRWNSTYDKLKCFLEMRAHLLAFKNYVATREGMKEFPDHATLPSLDEKDWLTPDCLFRLLGIFAVPSSVLGG